MSHHTGGEGVVLKKEFDKKMAKKGGGLPCKNQLAMMIIIIWCRATHLHINQNPAKDMITGATSFS